MKKLILSIVLLVCIMSSFQNANARVGASNSQTMSTAAVGWFSAGNFGCWGWNFCNGDAPWNTKGTTLQVYNAATDLVTFTIPFSALNDKNMEFYADKDIFRLEKDTKLSEAECDALRLPYGTVYIAGDYPLDKKNNALNFSVKVK